MNKLTPALFALVLAGLPAAAQQDQSVINYGSVAGGSGGGGGSGTVTSVALSFPNNVTCTVSGSPITTSGTLVCTPAGTSGGIPYFSSATALSSSAALTANQPVIGGGAGAAPTVGSRSGNTTEFATVSGSLTSGHLAGIDASGNIVDGGAAGTGNANFGTATGNTSGHAVTMANTTTGIQDAGFAPASAARLINSGAGLTGGGDLTADRTFALTELIRPVTSTTDTILSTDAAKLVTYSNASAIAVVLPQATGSFAAGFGFSVQNLGAGTVTITPTTSTINGVSTLAIAQNQGCDIVSDGTNWQVSACTAVGGSASGVSSITGTANQIAASASTGAVTLSLPANIQTTTLALNGATIGTNALAATGSINASTSITAGANITLGASSAIQFLGRAFITSSSANDVQIGNTNSASPSAQTLGFQNGAGTNIAGQNTTIIASVGSGNAAQGNLILQVGTPTTSGTGYGADLAGITIIGGSALVELPNVGSDATHTDATACIDTTSKGIFSGSGTAGVCLGNVSSRRFKTNINYIPDGLTPVMALKPADWFYKPGFGDGGARQQVGFIAEDFAGVFPKLARYDAHGKPNGTDILGTVPYLVRAVQQQQREINELWAALAAMFVFTCGGLMWIGRRR